MVRNTLNKLTGPDKMLNQYISQPMEKCRLSKSLYLMGPSFSIVGFSHPVSAVVNTVVTTVVTADAIDLTTLDSTQGFIVQGDVREDLLGTSVSSAGDVNGDGFVDVIIGAHFGDDEGSEAAGEAYVIFGGSGVVGATDGAGRQVVDLTTLSASEGFIIQGDAGNDQFAYSVASAGDINGDGFADLIAGARYGDDAGHAAGEAYVVFGGAGNFGVDVFGRQVIDLTHLNASEGFIIQGDSSGDQAAYSVSSAGDVNGDGFADIILGSPKGDDGGSSVGEGYIVFGGSGAFGANVSGRQVLDLSSLSASGGFIIQGDEAAGQAGRQVAGIGDVNDDGFDDVMLSAPFTDNPTANVGEAYVVFGGDGIFGSIVSGRSVVDVANLTATQGFVIRGGASSDQLGRFAFSKLGDINDDGIADLVINAPFADGGAVDSGGAYVVFGTTSGFGDAVGGRQIVELASLNSSQGFIVRGAAEDDRLRSGTGAGDFNGDGVADLLVGARKHDSGGVDAGAAYVVFGGKGTFGNTMAGQQVLDLANLSAAEGIFIQGDTASDDAGQSVSAAGDINGDGIDDIILGAPDGDDGGSDAGEAYIVFGIADAPDAVSVPMMGMLGTLVLLITLVAIARKKMKAIKI